MTHPPRPDSPRRVVVTGIGLVTGLGLDAETTWRGLKDGRSAAKWLVDPFGDGGSALFGCPIAGSSRSILDASIEADRDAGLAPGQVDPGRIGVVVGFSKGNVRGLAESRLHPGRLRPQPWSNWPGGPAGGLSELWNFRGPSLAPIAACATGVVSILRAADLIRRGTCDVVLAGAGDTQLEPICLAAFRKIHVLADVGDDPTLAARPWNRDRSGFVVGEGAAILVLEDADHARSRGILPYAEVAGGAMGSDAYHITDLNPDPTNLADLIGRAIENASLITSDFDHVNVHGTGTRVGDPLECRAIRRAFGIHADSLSCTANKSQIGHLLGAAGAAEAAIACLSIRDGFVPPTLNLTDPDPACDLDGTPIVGRKREIRAALKLSIGFGGHLAAVVFTRPDGPRRGPSDD